MYFIQAFKMCCHFYQEVNSLINKTQHNAQIKFSKIFHAKRNHKPISKTAPGDQISTIIRKRKPLIKHSKTKDPIFKVKPKQQDKLRQYKPWNKRHQSQMHKNTRQTSTTQTMKQKTNSTKCSAITKTTT